MTDELRDEAKELVTRLLDHTRRLPPKDRRYVWDMAGRLEHERYRVTRLRVFWLRDLAEKVGV